MTAYELAMQIMDQINAAGFVAVAQDLDDPSTPMQLVQACADNGLSVWWDNEAQSVKVAKP